MAWPRWTWEVGTVVAVGVLATLIAREMLRPPVLPPAPAVPIARAPEVVAVPPQTPPWYDPSIDPEAFKRAYPTPFEPVPVEKQRNYRKLYPPATDTAPGVSTAY